MGQQAYQVLLRATVVVNLVPFGYTFLALVTLDTARTRERAAGMVGILVTVAGILSAFVPDRDVTSVLAFELKMLARVGGLVALGLWLFRRSQLRAVTAAALENRPAAFRRLAPARCTISCTQSGVRGAGARMFPTAPSSFAQVAADTDSSVVNARVGPPATTYDATGGWHWVVTLKGQIVDEADFELEQDEDGTITSLGEGEGELFTFTRVAVTPRGIRYIVTLTGDGEPCDADLKGTAVLDTTTETITGTLSGKTPSEDQTSCETVGGARFVLTRNH